jgi:sortase A
MSIAERIDVDETAVAVDEAEPEPRKPKRRRGTSFIGAAGAIATSIALLFVLFAGFEFGLTKLIEARWQREALRDFKSRVASGETTVANFVPQPATPVGILSIPILNVRQVIIEGTTPNILKEGPGHVRGTPLPGQVGNAVIEGRRTTYGAPFARIDELVQGDEIDVTTGEGVFTYLVTGTSTIMPGQPDALASSQDNVLTLTTSQPALSVRGRFVVRASLQGPAFAAAARPAVPLEQKEIGLAGDDAAAWPAALWSAALVTGLSMVWGLRRRRGVNQRVLYLLTMPILVTVAVLAFENIDRLLPGTL